MQVLALALAPFVLSKGDDLGEVEEEEEEVKNQELFIERTGWCDEAEGGGTS